MRTLLFPLGLVLALATGASAQSTGKLSVSVASVRNDSGSVRCGLYSSADGSRNARRSRTDQERTGDLRVQRRFGRDLCDRRFPRRAQ